MNLKGIDNLLAKIIPKLDEYEIGEMYKVINGYKFRNEKAIEKSKVLGTDLTVHYDAISKIILKRNIYNWYFGGNESYSFNMNLDDEAITKDLKSVSEFEKSVKFNLTHIIKPFLKKLFINLTKSFSNDFDLKNLVSRKSKKVYENIDFVITLMKDMKLNNQDQVSLLLSVMSINIDNGILENYDFKNPKGSIKNKETAQQRKKLYNLHQRFYDAYYKPILDDRDVDIKEIETIFTDLGFKNTSVVDVIFKKRQESSNVEQKKEIPTNIILPKYKDNSIDKYTYYEVTNKISAYYDIDTQEVKRILTSDEIDYVVTLMRMINFKEETILRFVRTALKMHKKMEPIDRYLDLTKKIEFHKQNGQVAELDKTLKELLNEYIIANDDDKVFWYDSIVTELEELEFVMKNDFSYELRKKEQN